MARYITLLIYHGRQKFGVVGPYGKSRIKISEELCVEHKERGMIKGYQIHQLPPGGKVVAKG